MAISRALALDLQAGHLDHHLQRPTVQVTMHETLKTTQPFRDQPDIYVPLKRSLFKSAGITVSHFLSMLPSTCMQHCTQYHLYVAVSRESAF
jgi:hypothetical protein